MKTLVCKFEAPRRRTAPRGNERRLVTQHPRRRILSLVAGAAALPALSRMAWAQAYPTRPVRIIVGYPAGGANDILGRLMGQWLAERLGQPFIIENRPGAASNIATESVVRAPADGHTLLTVGSANAINSTLYDRLNYNFIRDIAAVAGLISLPNVMVLHPSVSAQTVPEFIAYAKANPGKLNFASSGNGVADHMCGELFKMLTGVNIVHVPYRGTAPALTDLLGGQVQMMFGNMANSIEHIRSGKLRALAVTTGTRLEVLPGIPTIGEFVFGYEGSGFVGIGAPRATPPDVIDKLNKEINFGLASSNIKARIADMGAAAFTGSPADFGKFLVDETEKWAKVVKFAGIRPD
jgi:tripartite-type tricarboxylate transporter receptor subunit TctC